MFLLKENTAHFNNVSYSDANDKYGLLLANQKVYWECQKINTLCLYKSMDVLQRTKLRPACKLRHVDRNHSCLVPAFRVHQNILAKGTSPEKLMVASILAEEFTNIYDGDASKLQNLDLFPSMCKRILGYLFSNTVVG